MPSNLFFHPASLILMGVIVGVYAGLMGLGGSWASAAARS
jgi:hypothetical protein